MSVEALTLRNQTVSSLLRLPREIRDRIYHFVLLYDGVVTMYPAPNGMDFCTESHSIHGCADERYTHKRPGDLRPDIPLRKACKQINHEARNVYFACNAFAFVGSGSMDQYEDRHFEVPEMNEIKTVQMTVKSSAVFGVFGESLQFNHISSCRIDDLKSMQKVSKIYIRILQGRDYYLPDPGFALPQPFSKAPIKPEVVLEMLKDEFETAGFRKATIHLWGEQKQERDPLKKVHGVRQWLDI